MYNHPPRLGEVRPVFLGGLLHGDMVPNHVREGWNRTNADYHAAQLRPGVVWAGEAQDQDPYERTTYRPQKFLWRSWTGRDIVVRIWVDIQLCERGRDVLLNRLIRELDWRVPLRPTPNPRQGDDDGPADQEVDTERAEALQAVRGENTSGGGGGD